MLFVVCVEGLMGKWDGFRKVARNSILNKYNSVLQRVSIVARLARAMFTEGKIVFSAEDVKTSTWLKVGGTAIHEEELPARDLLESLYNDFGILIEQTNGMFSFFHLQLQEYLTARSLMESGQLMERVEMMLNDGKRWAEVWGMLAPMCGDADILVRRLTSVFDCSSEDHFLAMKAFFENKPLASGPAKEPFFRVVIIGALDDVERIGSAVGYRDGIAINVDASLNHTTYLRVRRALRLLKFAAQNGYNLLNMHFTNGLVHSIKRECRSDVRCALVSYKGEKGEESFTVSLE
jgi:hypothetical protein